LPRVSSAVAQLLVVRPLHITMKKTSKLRLLRFGIFIGCICAVVALLEVCDLHPQLSVGRFHSIWVGVRHLDFTSETVTVPASGSDRVIERDYGFGPVKIAIEV